MKDLTGKRLMVLGGKTIMVDIVERAKKLGIYTVVVDNRPLEVSPAKQAADQYYNVSFAETDRMLEIIREEKIDGVITGFTDSYLSYYLDVCRAADLPCYGGEHQFDIAANKAAFKKACEDAGVPVIPGSSVRSFEEAAAEAHRQGYPVILKPSDNSGSRGVIKCPGEDELRSAYDYALSFSSNGLVIVEKFMDCDNIAVSYFAAGGEVRLTTTCERKLHISEESGSSITSFTVYPSRYTDRYIREAAPAVEKMLRDNDFHDGMIAFQAFVDEDSFYFCEMCFRPSGGHHYLLIDDQSGVDEMALFLEYAVTGEALSSWEMDKETPYFPNTCCMVKLIGTPGKKIARFDGKEEASRRENVIKFMPMMNVGDTIGTDGTTAQILAVIWYRCPDGKDPVEEAKDIAGMLKIEDENGEPLARVSIMK